MTRRLLASLIFALNAAPLLAQKDMGQAQQYYRQTRPNTKRFKVLQQTPKKGGEIKWQAGSQQIVKDEYAILEGNVTLEYQDIKVTTDKATYNFKTKDVVAQGHVIIDQGPTRLSGDQAIFNLDSKTGTFFNATGNLQGAIYFTGEKLEKVTEDEYRLTNGVITSCDLDDPSWSFHVRSADIKVDDYAHLRDLSFRAHGLPIFWAPRLIWPTKRDRSQGFLIPRVRFSSRFGQRLQLGYFIPMGDSVDTTLYTDLDTKGYNGVGIDLRYLPTPDIKLGELNAYTIHDSEAKKQQWKYAYRHSQDNLPGGFRGVVDVEDFSDLDFFRKFDDDPRLHTLSQVYSSAYLTKNRNNYSINLLTDRRDIILGHIDPNDPNSPISRQRYEQLPSFQFRVYPDRVFGSPVYFSMESSASHLITSGLVNGPSANYYRGDIFPTVSMQLHTPPWLSIKPQLSARETFYSESIDLTNSSSLTQVATAEALRRFYAQGQVEVIGPSFSRVYNRELGNFGKFKHVIEPRVRYIYTTNVNDQDRVIRFDTVDSPFLPIVRDSVEYSITQRLIAKEKGPNGSAREVLSFSLLQTVSLSKPFTNATGGSVPGSSIPPGVDNKFTPLVASLHVNPYQSFTVDASSTFSNVSHQLNQTSLSANVIGTGKNTDKYMSFTWFASFQQPGQTADATSSQIRLNTGSSLLRDKIRADVQLNFDAKNGQFLEQRYLIGGTASCYGIAVEYRRYLVYDPSPKPTTSYGVAITLKNVGTIGTH
jgi:lipopolysaccharide assembly outer membrane protein LptD (OstA)